MLHRLGQVGREVQPLALGREDLLESGLVDRHLAAAQQLDAFRVDVHAPHVVPELGETGGRHQADVADADDGEGLALGGHGQWPIEPQRRRDREHLAVRQPEHERVGHPVHGAPRGVGDEAQPVAVPEEQQAATVDRLVAGRLAEHRRVAPRQALDAVELAQPARVEDHPVGAVAPALRVAQEVDARLARVGRPLQPERRGSRRGSRPWWRSRSPAPRPRTCRPRARRRRASRAAACAGPPSGRASSATARAARRWTRRS